MRGLNFVRDEILKSLAVL